ncbi:MAG: hypothetical protein ACLTER_23900 [Ruminococcus sp.]
MSKKEWYEIYLAAGNDLPDEVSDKVEEYENYKIQLSNVFQLYFVHGIDK